MKDFIIKGRTVEHLVTFIVVIIIVSIINIFVLKYTGWICEGTSADTEIVQEQEDLAGKAAAVVEEEEEIPILLDAPGAIVIDEEDPPIRIQEEKPIQVAPAPEPHEEETESPTLSIPSGSFALTIENVGYTNHNEDLADADFVSVETVTLTLENNKQDFVPFVTFYLYDAQHKEHKNQYGESVYLDVIKKGDKRTEDVSLSSLSLENTDVDKIIVARITNAADDELIKREEYPFTP